MPPKAGTMNHFMTKSPNEIFYPLSQTMPEKSVHNVPKRMLDVIVAIGLTIILSPLLLIIGVLIKLDSAGPVIFKQTRVGKDGRLFEMWKLRSFCVDAEEQREKLETKNEMEGGVIFKMRNDPRLTRIGRYIRKASIDEIPQLWNVLTGEMSMVGPRPPLPGEVERYLPGERKRLAALPGITCVWQVSGRSEIPFKKQVEMDIAYIQSQSLKLDVVLLIRTIPAVLSGRGAY
jgi:lipopolysaccharide/colanic/teichoic acid biosynthesis glycosyltransferase